MLDFENIFVKKSFAVLTGSAEYMMTTVRRASQDRVSQARGFLDISYFIHQSGDTQSRATEHIKMINDHIPPEWRGGEERLHFKSDLHAFHRFRAQ